MWIICILQELLKCSEEDYRKVDGQTERDMFMYIGVHITDGERNRVIMEQNDYIIEKVRIPLVVTRRNLRVPSQGKQNI